MNILLEARALSASSGGVKTYTQELITNLIAQHPEASFDVMYSSNKANMFPGAKETVLPLYSEALLPFWMNAVARHIGKTKPTVAHFTKAAIPKKNTVPTVVTIYDIIPILFPETQSPLRRLYWPHALRHAAKHADHIMTISEQSKRDIIKYLDAPEDHVTVTPLAVDLGHFKSTSATASTDKYILFVGTRDARKNISSLIRAFAQIANTIPHNLVIAGRPAKKQDDSKEVAKSLKLEHRIAFREDVSYAQLPELYSNADIFVWPSVYEGWGFPPQEAMACGTPVIVSNGGPLPEVVGDAGVIVPLGDGTFIEQLSHEMLSLIQDDARKQMLRKKGLLRVQDFSWKNVAEKTWQVYTQLAL